MSTITKSAQETQELAAQTLSQIQNTNILALVGDLGSGKTTFVQGLARSLGVSGAVTSPTFLLLKSYPISNHARFSSLIHLDLYRINHWDEVTELDLRETWSDPSNLVVIEWAERIKSHLPEHARWIQFTHVNENVRNIAL